MRTDTIAVSSAGNDMEAILAQVDAVAEYKALSPRNAMHLRLLAEETMALMRAITGDVDGAFWMEDREGVFELHLRVEALTDENSRRQLLSAASSGKNEATRGFMGKVRAFFQPLQDVPMFSAGFAGGGAPQMYGDYAWSMEDYRRQLEQYRRQERDGAQEAWDELEKSVVSHVADDVRVSIRGRTVEMTVLKKMD